MKGFAAVCFVMLLPASSVLGKLGAPGGPLKLPLEPVDSIKVWETFEFAVSISDVDNDTIFECMSAHRLSMDPVTHKVVYVFDFPSAGGSLVFDSWPSDRMGRVYFKIRGDRTARDAVFYYTDYKNCLVADLELHGHQCTLWTQREVKDNVPQNCIDHFVDVCGVVPPQHSRDLCPDGEGDY